MNELLKSYSFLELSIIDSIRHNNKIYLDDLPITLTPLSDIIKSKDPKFEALYPVWAKQLISVVALLHEHKIVHTDIRPANIYVTPELNLKLGGFGRARLVINPSNKYITSAVCPKNYDPNIDKFGREVDTYWWMTDSRPAKDVLKYPTRFKAQPAILIPQVKTRIDIPFGELMYQPPEFICLGSQEWTKQNLPDIFKYDVWSLGLTLLELQKYRHKSNSSKLGLTFHKSLPTGVEAFQRNYDRLMRQVPNLDLVVRSMLSIRPCDRPTLKSIKAYGSLIPGYKLAYVSEDSTMLQTNLQLISEIRAKCNIIVTEEIFGNTVNNQAIEIAYRLLADRNIKARCLSENIVKFAYETAQALYYCDGVLPNDILEFFHYNFL